MATYVEGKTLFDINTQEMSESELSTLFSPIGKELATMDRILGKSLLHQAPADSFFSSSSRMRCRCNGSSATLLGLSQNNGNSASSA